MKNKGFQIAIVTAILALLLVGCGPSEEKLAQAEEARTLLLQARDSAEETYLDITDSTNRQKLDELSGKVSEIEAIDFTKMNDKKIDELLPTVTEITDSYQNMGKEMSEVLQVETEDREEKAKHKKVEVFFLNKTGHDLSKIVLHDKTRDVYSDNYLKDGVSLLNGYSLMGVTLDVYADSGEWEFVVTDEAGTDHNISCANLKEFKKDNITLSLDGSEAGGEESSETSESSETTETTEN